MVYFQSEPRTFLFLNLNFECSNTGQKVSLTDKAGSIFLIVDKSH